MEGVKRSNEGHVYKQRRDIFTIIVYRIQETVLLRQVNIDLSEIKSVFTPSSDKIQLNVHHLFTSDAIMNAQISSLSENNTKIVHAERNHLNLVLLYKERKGQIFRNFKRSTNLCLPLIKKIFDYKHLYVISILQTNIKWYVFKLFTFLKLFLL